MRRRKVSQTSCKRWRRLHWRRKEAPLHRLSPSITSISLYLSLNLSALLQDLKRKENTKEKKGRTPTYTTLKHGNPSLKSKTLPFWTSAGVYIGEGGFWKMRQGHASKIDAWPHHIVADPRQYQGLMSLVLVRGCVTLRGPSWYIWFLVISSEYSSDVSKGLCLMHLLDVPWLGLQEIQN